MNVRDRAQGQALHLDDAAPFSFANERLSEMLMVMVVVVVIKG